MDLVVTIGTAAIKEKARARVPRRARVTWRHMALGTQPWIANFKQTVIDRTMRFMTIGAVFHHGRMFPKKRPAPLGVAGVAVFIDACLFELRRIGTTMRVVTIRACNFPLAQRHMRRAHQLGFALQVTLAADLGFGPLVKEGILLPNLRQLMAVTGFFHHGMAIHTGNAAAGVGTRVPISLNTALVTLQAGFILDLGAFT